MNGEYLSVIISACMLVIAFITYNRGMCVEEVQAILGHENIATTMIYAKVSKNNVKLHHTKCIV